MSRGESDDLALAGDRPTYRPWRTRLPRLSVLVAVLMGIALSLAAFATGRRLELTEVEDRFQEAASDLSVAVRRGFAERLDLVYSVAALFAASVDVERSEFAAFTAPLLARHAGVAALSWAARVPADERAAWERRGRQDFPDFHITEVGPGGAIVPAGPRPEYYPVFYIEPYAGNEAALGFDLASEPLRRRTLQAALASRDAVATPRLRLVQERGTQAGFLVALPLFRGGTPHSPGSVASEKPYGFVTAVFRVADTVAAAARIPGAQRLSLVLCDEDAAADAQFLLATNGGEALLRARGASPCRATPGRGLFVDESMEVAGRRWRMTILPTAGNYSTAVTWQSWTALIGGLLLTAFIAAYLHVSRMRAEEVMAVNRRLTAEVRERMKAEGLLRTANRKLDRLSREDQLTRVANRRQFEEALQREWLRGIRSQQPVSVILVDVDYFKEFNDRYGHPEGDACLQRVAGALASALGRPGDLVARYGGDEFVVVLPETPPDGAMIVAERLLKAVSALAIPHSGQPMRTHVTVSLGVATTKPLERTGPHVIVREADRALYQAKQGGRGRIGRAEKLLL